MQKKSAALRNSTERSSFSERCYTLLSKVPTGSVTTYGELARALDTKAFRAVGQAMNRNPNAPHVPCHRVVCSDGSLGGYAFGIEKKIALLKKEGVKVKNGQIVNLEKTMHYFGPGKRK